MKTALIPTNEKERLSELHNFDLMHVHDEDFNDVVTLASQICKTPISSISLIDHSRQLTKAVIGLEKVSEDRETSFCAHTILSDDLFEVQNTLKDERFHDNPLVQNHPNIRYYAGMPLITSNGYKIGALCVIDTVPRSISAEQSFALKVLSRQTVKLLEAKMLVRHSLSITEVQQRIISVMSHDMRSPLNSMKMFLELRRNEKENFSEEETENMLAMFDVNVSRTIQLLNNLVEWSQLQRQFEKRKDYLNLFTVVKECIEQAELNVVLKRNTILNTVNPMIFIESDKEAIQFILRNLISNANKFTEDGTIKISSYIKDNQRIFLTVEDDGVGIEMSKINDILEEKGNYHTDGTQHEKGNGLGLSLIKTYLDQTGNELHIESKLRKGTSVSFSVAMLK